MTKRKSAPFPDKEDILEYIRENPDRAGKREIARAFRLSTEQKVRLKHLLKEFESEGLIQRGRGRRFIEPGVLPPVAMLVVSGIDLDGEITARPVKWDDDAPPPVIYMMPERRGQPALGVGDRVLARLQKAADGTFEARTIRRIAEAPPEVLGVYHNRDGKGWLQATDRRAKRDYMVIAGEDKGATGGDLVWAEVMPGRHLGPRQVRVKKIIGAIKDARSVSLIALHQHEIPYQFPDDVVAEAEAAAAPPLEGRDDFRDVPLITIDGADARDFDDAVWAQPDEDVKNPGGWHLLVAIADVSWYVRPGSPLDQCAYDRGNSVYFPDRVVPMLPEALSNGWCSLRPNEDRSCLVAHLWITADGTLKRFKFTRALMRSAARLTYEQVQAARDGQPDKATAPLVDTVIAPLYGAYEALMRSREHRGVLNLDLPERRIVLDDDGNVTGVEMRQRFDSHRLIEEFMIMANVAAAKQLEKKRQPCMYRVHDNPSPEKIEALREFLDSIGIRFAAGQRVTPARFNQILAKAAGTPESHMVSVIVLRSQAQAAYSPVNLGHFGLALTHYGHFTSPIRRYADLLVHRALVRGLGLGEGALEQDHGDFVAIGEHISMTERRAAKAERDAVDRFTALYLVDRIGAEFAGRINGVTRFGLFVTLDETGADGLVPISSLADDYYEHDERRHQLVGRHSGRRYHLGAKVDVVLAEANPVTGGMVMNLIDNDEPEKGVRRHKGRRISNRAKTSSRTSKPKDKRKKKTGGKAKKIKKAKKKSIPKSKNG